jgi:rRNA maturation protein Nop10
MATATEQRLYEMFTENTGVHFLDSGMSDGRHWQQNQKLTINDFLARPKATLETEFGTYPTLDLFHFLNDRLELTEKAKELEADFRAFVDDDNSLSYRDIETMETWAQFAHEGTEKNPTVANSYNWDNYLSQTIQYLTFENSGRWFVMLQIHGGADVRGGYTLPQIFEMYDEYCFFGMSSCTVQCTGEGCTCPEGSEPCQFAVDIRGCVDIIGTDGCVAMTSSEFYELKRCPECGGELEAIAPEPSSW